MRDRCKRSVINCLSLFLTVILHLMLGTTVAFDLAIAKSGGCATTENLELLCWGVNENELFGSKDKQIFFRPTEVFPGVAASKVALGSNHLCIVGEDDDGVFCKGDNLKGQCGVNSFVSPIVELLPTSLTGPIKQLAAGKKSTCAIIDSSDNQSTVNGNNLFCWGQVLPELDGLFEPTLMSSERAVYVAVSDHKAAVFFNGVVGTFHLNDAFQLAIGPTTEPILFLNDSNITRTELWGSQVTSCTGRKHTCVLSLDGRVACAGANNRGQLGLGHRRSQSSFTYINDEKKEVSQLACGAEFTCYVLSDGQAKCFGANDFGQLAIGDQEDRSVPTLIPAFRTEKVSKIVLGDFTGFAIMRDASVRVWGRNDKAQLGLGPKAFLGDNVTSPVFHDSLTVVSRNSAPFPVGLQLFLTLFSITLAIILVVAFKEFWLGAYIRSKNAEIRQKDRKIFKLQNQGLYYQDAEESNSSLDKKRALVIEQLMPCIECYEQISKQTDNTNVFHVATLCALSNLSFPGLDSGDIASLQRVVEGLCAVKAGLMENNNNPAKVSLQLEELSKTLAEERLIYIHPLDFARYLEAKKSKSKMDSIPLINYKHVSDGIEGWEYQAELLHQPSRFQRSQPNLLTKLKWKAQSVIPLFPPVKPAVKKSLNAEKTKKLAPAGSSLVGAIQDNNSQPAAQPDGGHTGASLIPGASGIPSPSRTLAETSVETSAHLGEEEKEPDFEMSQIRSGGHAMNDETITTAESYQVDTEVEETKQETTYDDPADETQYTEDGEDKNKVGMSDVEAQKFHNLSSKDDNNPMTMGGRRQSLKPEEYDVEMQSFPVNGIEEKDNREESALNLTARRKSNLASDLRMVAHTNAGTDKGSYETGNVNGSGVVIAIRNSSLFQSRMQYKSAISASMGANMEHDVDSASNGGKVGASQIHEKSNASKSPSQTNRPSPGMLSTYVGSDDSEMETTNVTPSKPPPVPSKGWKQGMPSKADNHKQPSTVPAKELRQDKPAQATKRNQEEAFQEKSSAEKPDSAMTSLKEKSSEAAESVQVAVDSNPQPAKAKTDEDTSTTIYMNVSVEPSVKGAGQTTNAVEDSSLGANLMATGKSLWAWLRNNCLFKPFIDGIIDIYVRVTEYPIFYFIFTVMVLGIFFSFAAAKVDEILSVGVNADRPGGFRVTFLPIPPQYDLDRPLQNKYIPALYGVMHCNLFFLGLLPLPMMRGAIRALVQRKSFLCKLIPLDDAVFLHRFFAYCLLGGLIIGCGLWLYTMGFECVDNEQAQACLAFDLSNLNPKDNVLMLRVLVWITWFLILPLLYFVRRGPWSFLPRSIKQYHFELVYFSHLIVAYSTLILALIARFEVFYPVLISWSIYFIGMAVDYLLNFHSFEISLGSEICKDAKGTPTSIRLELFDRKPLLSCLRNRKPRFEAGQWVYLYVVDEKRWWMPVFAHPFSIAYAPAKRKSGRNQPNALATQGANGQPQQQIFHVADTGPGASNRSINQQPGNDTDNGDSTSSGELELHIGIIKHRMLKKTNGAWKMPKNQPRPWTDMLRDIMPEATHNSAWKGYRKAKEGNPDRPPRTTGKRVYVLGPYGTAFASCFERKNNVSIVIGAGTGLTAAESVLRRFAEEKSKPRLYQDTLPRMLWFVWSASTTDDLKWCWNTLLQALVTVAEAEINHGRDPRQWVSSSSNQLAWVGLTFYLTKVESLSQISEFKEEMLAKARKQNEKARPLYEWVTNFMANQIHAGSLVDEETHVKHLLKAIYTKASVPENHAPSKMAVAYCGAPDLATAILQAQRELTANNVVVDIEFSFDSQ